MFTSFSNTREGKHLADLAKLIRYWILNATTKAGSGHATSSLSAVEIMTVLFFNGFFRYNIKDPDYCNNDRLIFSKGHASPLFYTLWAVAGGLSREELLDLRQLGSRLEGHPTMEFPFTEAATGSLGQGLSMGLGMALAARYLDKLSYRTYVLMGDSELSEGQVWEAAQLAAYYKLNNLVAIVDVNRLGQRGPTMFGYDLAPIEAAWRALGWNTLIVDGHDLSDLNKCFITAVKNQDKPLLILAKTIKGKGVSFLENKNGWHGRALTSHELVAAMRELGPLNLNLTGKIKLPDEGRVKLKVTKRGIIKLPKLKDNMSTRQAYGVALNLLAPYFPELVSLDAEVSNSTGAGEFALKNPNRFFEMFIAEQNMISAAVGLSRRGKLPFVSTFSAFLTRGFDQIRLANYSKSNIKFLGSHCGVSIGQDGVSQMGLEDIAMFRAVPGAVIFYPADATAMIRLTAVAAKHQGLVYLRATREATPKLYKPNDKFVAGGSKVWNATKKDVATIVAAGVTLFEALKAQKVLRAEKINIRVIDLYSVEPLDEKTLKQAARETGLIITVEDAYPHGGIGEAVQSIIGDKCKVMSLAVRNFPHSGKPEELRSKYGIDAEAIVASITKLNPIIKFKKL